MDGFDLNKIPKINFVFDFKLSNGYLPFGYTKSTFPINVFNTNEKYQSSGYTLYHSSVENPNNYTSTFAAPFATYVTEYTKNTKIIGTWDIKEVNLDEYYLIVIESLPTNNMFEYYNNDILKIEELISPKLLNFLKKYENFKLIFMDIREGSYFHDFNFLKKINKFLIDNEITHENKVIVSSSDNFIINLKNIPEYTKFKNKINVYPNNYLLFNAGRFIGQLKKLNNVFLENDYSFSIQEKIHFNKREKHFLMYNRNSERMHRPYFVNKLYTNNLLDKGIISFFENPYLDSFLENSTEYVPLKLNKDDILNIKENYKNFTPMIIDNDNADEVAAYHNYLSRKDEYEKTYFSIVSETNAEPYYCFITEKTMKPIMNLHPFVVVGNPHILKVLKSYGFQTFDKWWDESYDNEFDFKKRAEKVFFIVKDLCEKSHEEWDVMLKDMESVLNYNKNLLHKLNYKKIFQKEFFQKVLERKKVL